MRALQATEDIANYGEELSDEELAGVSGGRKKVLVVIVHADGTVEVKWV